jgi:hypothetical protein
MTISKGVRIIHKDGSSMESSVTSVFDGIEAGKFLGHLEDAAVLPAIAPAESLLFHYPDAL